MTSIRLVHTLLICVSFYFLCGTQFAVAEKEKLDEPHYVSSSRCISCHADEHDRWQGSDHSWAWRKATEENVLGDFDNKVFEHQGIRTFFFKNQAGFWIETKNQAGKKQRYKIEYVVGIRPLQQYLVKMKDGRVQTLDIAWDVEQKNWYMVFPEQTDNIPGNALHWTGVYKNWNGRCAECHATNYQKNYDIKNNSFSSHWSELGVTCQACHGPASTHLKWAENPNLLGKEGSDKLTGKGFLKKEGGFFKSQEIEQCAACHSRRIAFDEKTPHYQDSFHNGFDLNLILEDFYYPDGQIKDEVFVVGSFLQSKMHEAGVTCSDCHDPHSGETKAKDNSLCTQCHSKENSARFNGLKPKDYDTSTHHKHSSKNDGSLCVSCHMPGQNYMVIDNRRDHKFSIPSPAMSKQLNTPNACSQCHTEKGIDWAINSFEYLFPDNQTTSLPSHSIFASLEQENQNKGREFNDLLSVVHAKDEAVITRASAIRRMAPYSQQIDWSQLLPYLNSNEYLVKAAAINLFQHAPASYRAAHLPKHLKDTAKPIRIAAAKGLMNLPRGSISSDSARALGSAVREFQKSLLAQADHPSTQLALAGLALTFKNIPAANAAVEKALVLDPQLEDAWVMKVRINSALKRPDLTLKDIDMALKAVPSSANLRHYFGNYLASQRQFPRAIKLLRQALDLTPDTLQIKIDLSAILLESGDTGTAISLLEEITATSSSPDALYLLGTGYLKQEDIHSARTVFFRLLMENPAYQLPPDVQRAILDKNKQ